MTEPRTLLEAALHEAAGVVVHDAGCGSAPAFLPHCCETDRIVGDFAQSVASTPSAARLLALAADAQRQAEENERLREHLDAASRRAHQCGHGTGPWAWCDAPSCVMDRAVLDAVAPR